MSRLFLFLAGILVNLSLSAQVDRAQEFLVGGNAGLIYPVGDFSSGADYGFGVNITGRWLVNKQIAVGIESGFTCFAQDDDFWDAGNWGDNNVSFQLIPVLLSGTYIIKAWDHDFKPYTSLAFGYYFFRNRVEFSSANSDPYPYNTNPSLQYTIRQNRAGLAPTIGFMYYLSDKLIFDLNARYIYIPSFPKTLRVKQKLTNVVQGEENFQYVENYFLGFTQLSAISFSMGVMYRF